MTEDVLGLYIEQTASSHRYQVVSMSKCAGKESDEDRLDLSSILRSFLVIFACFQLHHNVEDEDDNQNVLIVASPDQDKGAKLDHDYDYDYDYFHYLPA